METCIHVHARTRTRTHTHTQEEATSTLQYVPQNTKYSKDKVENSKGKINGNITRGTYSVWLAIKIRTAFTWHKLSIKRNIVFIVISVYTSIFLCMWFVHGPHRPRPPARQHAAIVYACAQKCAKKKRTKKEEAKHTHSKWQKLGCRNDQNCAKLREKRWSDWNKLFQIKRKQIPISIYSTHTHTHTKWDFIWYQQQHQHQRSRVYFWYWRIIYAFCKWCVERKGRMQSVREKKEREKVRIKRKIERGEKRDQ